MPKYRSGFSVGRRNPVTISKDDPRARNVNLYSSRSGRDVNVVSFQTQKNLDLGTITIDQTQSLRASTAIFSTTAGFWGAQSNLFDGTVGDSNTTFTLTSGLNQNASIYVQAKFGISIPTDATISSVVVKIRHKIFVFSSTVNTPTLQPYISSTPLGSSQNLTKSTATNGIEDTITFTGLTATDLLDSNFGIRYAATTTATNTTNVGIAYMDIYINYQETS